MACALDYLDKSKAKKAVKVHAIQKREFLDNDKSFQKAKSQRSFNEFIRLRDAHLGCVSCDKPSDWHGQWHCGHFKTVGARPDLRFNEDNCHKQCSVCNNYLSGNLIEYRRELENRIGTDRLLALDVELKPKKYTAQDYKNIHLEYQQKIKELKANPPTKTYVFSGRL
jgi:hypothetical protein